MMLNDTSTSSETETHEVDTERERKTIRKVFVERVNDEKKWRKYLEDEIFLANISAQFNS